jgi:hypothetical protein
MAAMPAAGLRQHGGAAVILAIVAVYRSMPGSASAMLSRP